MFADETTRRPIGRVDCPERSNAGLSEDICTTKTNLRLSSNTTLRTHRSMRNCDRMFVLLLSQIIAVCAAACGTFSWYATHRQTTLTLSRLDRIGIDVRFSGRL